ncbi:MAG: Asp23/Gls24 family envelope stress response protein [Eggerthellaceae bacterium]|nr:Asp23/Gls24 family envelope stress response protein [Eggerthellaceae bacterium]
MSDLRLDGMTLADGVVETIINIAMQNVEGVAGVSLGAGIWGALGQKTPAPAIEVSANDDNTLSIAVHIEAVYGHALPEVAARVRQTIYDAVLIQVGVEASKVDVYIDGIQFA